MAKKGKEQDAGAKGGTVAQNVSPWFSKGWHMVPSHTHTPTSLVVQPNRPRGHSQGRSGRVGGGSRKGAREGAAKGKIVRAESATLVFEMVSLGPITILLHPPPPNVVGPWAMVQQDRPRDHFQGWRQVWTNSRRRQRLPLCVWSILQSKRHFCDNIKKSKFPNTKFRRSE